MEVENSHNFNERLSQWVASQGFWFQLRHPLSGGEGTGHVMSLFAKVGLFLLIVSGLVLAGYLKMIDSPSQKKALERAMCEGLQAKELILRKSVHNLGILKISRLASRGGENTFFENMEAFAVRFHQGFLGKFSGKWNVGVINVDRLDLELRAGAETAESAAKISQMLFKQADKYQITGLNCESVSLRWGETEPTKGFLQGSEMTSNRVGDRWLFTFKGGTFSQNWLNDLKVVELVVSCTPEKMVFEKASFQGDGSKVDLKGLEILTGKDPVVNGTAHIQHLNLDDILPSSASGYVAGYISGDFKMSGSLNSEAGVIYEGLVKLGGTDLISFRDRVKILDALALADSKNKYSRLTFTDGSFMLRTAKGGMQLTELSLKSGDLLTLSGEMIVRPPTFEETSQLAIRQMQVELTPSIQEAASGGEGSSFQKAKSPVARNQDLSSASEAREGSDLLEMESSADARAIAVNAAELAMKSYRYGGRLRISLMPDVFEKAPRLAARVPQDILTKRYYIDIPLEGTIEDITLEKAQEIIDQTRN